MITCDISSYSSQVQDWMVKSANNNTLNAESVSQEISKITDNFLKQNSKDPEAKIKVEKLLNEWILSFNATDSLKEAAKGLKLVLNNLGNSIPEKTQSSSNPTGNKSDKLDNIDPSLAEGSIFSRLFGKSNTAKLFLYKLFQTKLFKAACQTEDKTVSQTENELKKFHRTSSSLEISSNIDDIKKEYFYKLKAAINSDLEYYNDGKNQTRALLEEYFGRYNAIYSKFIDTTDLGEHYVDNEEDMRAEEKAALYYYILNNFDAFVSETSKLHGESFVIINNDIDLNNSDVIYKYSLKKRSDSKASWLSDDELLYDDLNDLSPLLEYLLAKPRWINGHASNIPLTKSEIFNTIGFIKNISAKNILGAAANIKAIPQLQQRQGKIGKVASISKSIEEAYKLCKEIYGEGALQLLLENETLQSLIAKMYDYDYIPIIFIYLNSLRNLLELSPNQRIILNSIYENFFNPNNAESEIRLSMNTEDLQNVPFDGLLWISQSISAYYTQSTWDYNYTTEEGFNVIDIGQRSFDMRQYKLKADVTSALLLKSKLRKRPDNKDKVFTTTEDGYIPFDGSNKIEIKLYPTDKAVVDCLLDVRITLSNGSQVFLKEKVVKQKNGTTKHVFAFSDPKSINKVLATKILLNLFADYTISETVVGRFLERTDDFTNLISGILKAHQLTLQFYVVNPDINDSNSTAAAFRTYIKEGFNEDKTSPHMLPIYKCRIFLADPIWGVSTDPFVRFSRIKDEVEGVPERSTNTDLMGAKLPPVSGKCVNASFDEWLYRFIKKNTGAAAHHLEFLNLFRKIVYNRNIKSKDLDVAEYRKNSFSEFLTTSFILDYYGDDYLAVMPAVISDKFRLLKAIFNQESTVKALKRKTLAELLLLLDNLDKLDSKSLARLKYLKNLNSENNPEEFEDVELKDLTQEDFEYLLKKDFGTFHRNVFKTIQNKFKTLGENLEQDLTLSENPEQANSKLYRLLLNEYELLKGEYKLLLENGVLLEEYELPDKFEINILDGFRTFNLVVSRFLAKHEDYTMEKVLHELFLDEQQYLIKNGLPIKKYITDTDVIVKNKKLWVNPSLLHQLYIYGNDTDQQTVAGIVRALNYHVSILETYDEFMGRKTDLFVSELFYNNVKLTIRDVNGHLIRGKSFENAKNKNKGFVDIHGNIAPCTIQEEGKEYPRKIGSQHDLRQYRLYNDFYKYCLEEGPIDPMDRIDLEKLDVRHPRFSIKYFERMYNSHLGEFNDWLANRLAFKKYLNANIGSELELFIKAATLSRFETAKNTTDETYRKNLILGAASEDDITEMSEAEQKEAIEGRIRERLKDKPALVKASILFAEISRNYGIITEYIKENEKEFLELKGLIKPKTEITVEINPELVKYNLASHWLGYSFVLCSSGADFGNPVVGDILTDHIADIEAEMSKAATKRNVSMTAILRPFIEGVIGGTPSKYKMLPITDMRNMGYNISGNTGKIKVLDGVTFVSMLTCYEENTALGGDSVGLDKKQFVSSYISESGVSEEIKTAGMVVDNNMIKHGIGCPRYSCERIGEQLFLIDLESKDAPKEISEANAFSEWCAANESVNAMGFMWNLNKMFNDSISWTLAFKLSRNEDLRRFDWTKGGWIKKAVDKKLIPSTLYRKNPDGSIIAIKVDSISVNEDGLTTFEYQRVDQTGASLDGKEFTKCTIIGAKDEDTFKKIIEAKRIKGIREEYIINYENPNGYINSNYQLWLYVFGGFMTMHKDSNNILTDADDKTSMELLYFASKNALTVKDSNIKVISRASHYSVLSDSKIDYSPTVGSMKKSVSNVNDVSEVVGRLVDGRKVKPRVIWSEFEAANIGIQLDAEHSAIDSTLSLMTQVVNALAARGYSIELTSECYLALYQLTISSLDHVFDGVTVLNPSKKSDEELKGKFAKIIVDSVINGAKTGLVGLLQELLEGLLLISNRGEYSQYISIDNPVIFNKIISNIAAAITKSSVKFKFHGGMNVLVPSDGTAQIINGHSAQYYIDGEHTKTLYIDIKEANDKFLEPAELIMGHWYNVIQNEGEEAKLIELNPEEFYSICQSKPYKISEAVGHPRDLGVYNNTFKDTNGNSYNIWQLRSVRLAYTNPNNKVAYKQMVEELRGISKNGYSKDTVVSVFENGDWIDKTITVDKDSIQISPFEAILPSSYKHQFRLKEGLDLQEVLDDPNHFIKTLLNERITQKINSDYYTVAFSARNAKTCYLVDKAIKNTVPKGFTDITKELILVTDSTTGVTYRLDAITKEPMYAVPNNVEYNIYRDSLGHEIIKTDSLGILEFSKSLNFSEVQFGNAYSLEVIDGAKNGSVALVTLVLEYLQSAADSGKTIKDIIKDSNNAENIRPIANLIDLASELNIDVNTSVENDTLATDILKKLFDLWNKDPKNPIFQRCVNERILPKNFTKLSNIILEDGTKKVILRLDLVDKIKELLVDLKLDLVKSSIREGKALHTAFEKSLEYVAARTPSQSHLSFMTMRVVAFNDTERNVAYVSRWQLWLQGSDFDIDKVSLLGYDFNHGKFITHSPYSNLTSKEGLEATMQMPLPTGFELEKVGEKDIDDSAYHYMTKTIYGNRTVVKEPNEEGVEKEFLQYNIKDLASSRTAVLRTVSPALNNGANYKCTIERNSSPDTLRRNLFIYLLAHNIIDRLNVGESIYLNSNINENIDLDANTALGLILQNNGFVKDEHLPKYTKDTKAEKSINFAKDWETFVSYWLNSTEFNINSLKSNPSSVTLKRLIPLLLAFSKYGKTHLDAPTNGEDENSKILNIINTYNTYFLKGSGMYFKLGALQNFIVHKMAAISADPLNAIQGQSPIDDAVNDIKKIANASIIAAATKSFDRGAVTSLILQVLLTIGGKDNIKIVATALKVFEAMYTYQCKVLNTGSSLELANLLVEHNIGGYRILLCANVAAANPITVVNQDVEEALIRVNQSIDAFLEESGLLSLATDNAKDPSLSKMNGDAEMMPLYTAGVACGIPIKYLSEVMLTLTGRDMRDILRSNIYTGLAGLNNHSLAINYLKSGPTLTAIPENVKEAFINYIVELFNLANPLFNSETGEPLKANNKMLSNLLDLLTPRQRIWAFTELEGAIRDYIINKDSDGENAELDGLDNEGPDGEDSKLDSLDNKNSLDASLYKTVNLKKSDGEYIKISLPRALLHFIREYLEYLYMCIDRDSDYVFNSVDGHSYKAITILSQLSSVATEMKITSGLILNQGLPNSFDDLLSFVRKFESILQNLRQNARYTTSLSRYEDLKEELSQLRGKALTEVTEADKKREELLQIEIARLTPLFEENGLLDKLTERNRDLFPISAEEYESEREKDYDIRVNFSAFIEDLGYRDLVLKIADCYTTLTNPLRVIMNNDHYKGDLIATAEVFTQQTLNSILYQTIDHISTNLLRGHYKISDSKTLEKAHKLLKAIIGYEIISLYFRGNEVKIPDPKTGKLVTLNLGDPKTGHTARLAFKRAMENALPLLLLNKSLANNIFIKHLNLGTFDLTITHAPTDAIKSTIKTNFENSDTIAREKLDRAVEDLHELTKYKVNGTTLYDMFFYYTLITYGSESNSQTLLQFFYMDLKNSTRSDAPNSAVEYLKFVSSLNEKENREAIVSAIKSELVYTENVKETTVQTENEKVGELTEGLRQIMEATDKLKYGLALLANLAQLDSKKAKLPIYYVVNSQTGAVEFWERKDLESDNNFSNLEFNELIDAPINPEESGMEDLLGIMDGDEDFGLDVATLTETKYYKYVGEVDKTLDIGNELFGIEVVERRQDLSNEQTTSNDNNTDVSNKTLDEALGENQGKTCK